MKRFLFLAGLTLSVSHARADQVEAEAPIKRSQAQVFRAAFSSKLQQDNQGYVYFYAEEKMNPPVLLVNGEWRTTNAVEYKNDSFAVYQSDIKLTAIDGRELLLATVPSEENQDEVILTSFKIIRSGLDVKVKYLKQEFFGGEEAQKILAEKENSKIIQPATAPSSEEINKVYEEGSFAAPLSFGHGGYYADCYDFVLKKLGSIGYKIGTFGSLREANLQPGYVLQLRNFRWEGNYSNQHWVIIEAVDGDQVRIVHSNYNGKKTLVRQTRSLDSFQGTIHLYSGAAK